MTLCSFSATDFRCLAAVSLDVAPRYNLVYGANASGKTSLLEAIAYLGLGRSFRGAGPDRLVRYGASEFLLFGRANDGSRGVNVGVANGRDGLRTRIDGETRGGVSGLARVLPLQVVEPEVHDLVAGGPEHRRRYLDWIAFHVEPGYLDLWRRFRRALKQRNAALRERAGAAELDGWTREFVDLALKVDAVRGRTLAGAEAALVETGGRLVGEGVDFEYRRGWGRQQSLEDALRSGLEQDAALGTTRCGPQRADVRLSYKEHQARKSVSRGQQKLLACTLILAATRVVQDTLGRPILLLLDDPAAELDGRALERLMAAVSTLGSQVIATALGADATLFPEAPARFHVEQGRLRRVA